MLNKIYTWILISIQKTFTFHEIITYKCCYWSSHVPILWLLREGQKIIFIITMDGCSFSSSRWIWSCLNIPITSILNLIGMFYPLLIDCPIHSPHIDCWNWQGQFSLTWNVPLLQMQNQITLTFMDLINCTWNLLLVHKLTPCFSTILLHVKYSIVEFSCDLAPIILPSPLGQCLLVHDPCITN